MPKPNPRRDGREAAIQFLFSIDARETSEAELHEQFSEFWQLRQANEKVQGFAESIITETLKHLEQIDCLITDRLDNFEFDRLNKVDRNILRVGVFEVCFADYIPRAAAINEAIEIAKRFGTEESSKFVNGVLDRIKKEDLETV